MWVRDQKDAPARIEPLVAGAASQLFEPAHELQRVDGYGPQHLRVEQVQKRAVTPQLPRVVCLKPKQQKPRAFDKLHVHHAPQVAVLVQHRQLQKPLLRPTRHGRPQLRRAPLIRGPRPQLPQRLEHQALPPPPLELEFGADRAHECLVHERVPPRRL